MSEPLSHDDVRKVANLARLKLSEAEVETFAKQLGDVLGYIDVLSEVDVDGIEPMAHAVELSNVFRDDERRESLPRDEALANAPSSDGKYFLVPPILDTD